MPPDRMVKGIRPQDQSAKRQTFGDPDKAGFTPANKTAKKQKFKDTAATGPKNEFNPRDKTHPALSADKSTAQSAATEG